MGKGVKEWNTDVLQRKYQDSWVIFERGDALTQHWVIDCSTDGKETVFNTNVGTYKDILPVYFSFESGYYTSPKDEVYLLERKFTAHKNFKVGLDAGGWSLWKINTGTGDEKHLNPSSETIMDFLNGPDRTKFLQRGLGAICRKYLLTQGNIYYKGNIIGARENKEILLDNNIFRKDLQHILGASWQVS